MTDHQIQYAIGELQKQMREMYGFSPHSYVDFTKVHLHDDPTYKLAEALDFYAHAKPEDVARDGGAIARETLKR